MFLLFQSDITPRIHTQGVATLAQGYAHITLSGRTYSDGLATPFQGEQEDYFSSRLTLSRCGVPPHFSLGMRRETRRPLIHLAS